MTNKSLSQQLCEACGIETFAQRKKGCIFECKSMEKILDIISGFADGRSKASPDSEQIEHTAAKPQMRNSVSVEQIQDNKTKEEG